jgi:hypothetical protein
MPHQAPAELRVRPQQREFWRVLNASAGTYFNLQVLYRHGPYDFIPEHFQVIALDGAPIGGNTATPPAPRTDLLIPPGGRAEFIVTTPPVGMPGRFVTRWYATGPDGLAHPERIIANIISSENSPAAASTIPGIPVQDSPKAIPAGAIPPVRHRRLYFSEDRQDRVDPKKPAKYFITVEGQTESLRHEFQNAGYRRATRDSGRLGNRKPRARVTRSTFTKCIFRFWSGME